MTASMDGPCRKCDSEGRVEIKVRVKGGGTELLKVTCPTCQGRKRGIATK